jgi:hypothetical protein
MKQIEEAIDRLSREERERSEEDMSIVQKILRKTSNPKMAAVLALDLLLVGVDTVSTLGTPRVRNTCFGGICMTVVRKYHCIFHEQDKCDIQHPETDDLIQK